MKSPIFLLCSERSGSNLITRIFDAHPAISAPVPPHLFRIVGTNIARYGDLKQKAARRSLGDDITALFEAKLGSWAIDDEDWRSLLEAEAPPQAMIAALYDAEAARAGKRTVLIKENHAYEFLHFLLAGFPDARFLHLVRDPRDMALSWLRAAALRGGPVRATGIWLRDQEGALGLLARLNGKAALTSIRYEDLITRPAETLQAACAALGENFDPAMLRFFEGERIAGNAAQVFEWRNTSRPILTDNSGKFRDGLAAEQIAFVEHECGALMQAFGYRPEMPPLQNPAETRARLTAAEPMEKPAYRALPQDEREARRRWTEIVARIIARPLPVD